MKVQVPPYVHNFAAPVVLMGCGTVQKPNLITCCWFGTVCSKPPMVSVSITKTRYSYDPIVESREFTVNLPKVSQLDAVKFCGKKSGRDYNKFETLGLTAQPCAPLTHAPMMAEAFIALGCKVKSVQELGSHDIFIAEIVSIHGEEELKRDNGKFDPLVMEQLIYLDKKYWTPILAK